MRCTTKGIARPAAAAGQEHQNCHLESGNSIAIAPCVDAACHHWQGDAKSGDCWLAMGVDDGHN